MPEEATTSGDMFLEDQLIVGIPVMLVLLIFTGLIVFLELIFLMTMLPGF
jgi:hypothetical protein